MKFAWNIAVGGAAACLGLLCYSLPSDNIPGTHSLNLLEGSNPEKVQFEACKSTNSPPNAYDLTGVSLSPYPFPNVTRQSEEGNFTLKFHIDLDQQLDSTAVLELREFLYISNNVTDVYTIDGPANTKRALTRDSRYFCDLLSSSNSSEGCQLGPGSLEFELNHMISPMHPLVFAGLHWEMQLLGWTNQTMTEAVSCTNVFIKYPWYNTSLSEEDG